MKLRKIARSVLLAWLAAEWIGVIFAYTLSIGALGFLCVFAVAKFYPNLDLLSIGILGLVVVGWCMAYWVAKIPRDLIVLAKQV